MAKGSRYKKNVILSKTKDLYCNILPPQRSFTCVQDDALR